MIYSKLNFYLILFVLVLTSVSFSHAQVGEDDEEDYSDPLFYENSNPSSWDYSQVDWSLVPAFQISNIPVENIDYSQLSIPTQTHELTPAQIIANLDNINNLFTDVMPNRAATAIQSQFGITTTINSAASISGGILSSPNGDSVNLNNQNIKENGGMVRVTQEGTIQVIYPSNSGAHHREEEIERPETLEFDPEDKVELRVLTEDLHMRTQEGELVSVRGELMIERGNKEIVGNGAIINNIEVTPFPSQSIPLNLAESASDSTRDGISIGAHSFNFNPSHGHEVTSVIFKEESNFFNVDTAFIIEGSQGSLHVQRRDELETPLIPLVYTQVDGEDFRVNINGGQISLSIDMEGTKYNIPPIQGRDNLFTDSSSMRDFTSGVEINNPSPNFRLDVRRDIDNFISTPREEISAGALVIRPRSIESNERETFISSHAMIGAFGDRVGDSIIDRESVEVNGVNFFKMSEELRLNSGLNEEVVNDILNDMGFNVHAINEQLPEELAEILTVRGISIPEEYIPSPALLNLILNTYDQPSLRGFTSSVQDIVVGPLGTGFLGFVADERPEVVFYSEAIDGVHMISPVVAIHEPIHSRHLFDVGKGDDRLTYMVDILTENLDERTDNHRENARFSQERRDFISSNIDDDFTREWALIHGEYYGVHTSHFDPNVWNKERQAEIGTWTGPGFGCISAYGCSNLYEDVATMGHFALTMQDRYLEVISPDAVDMRPAQKLSLFVKYDYLPAEVVSRIFERAGFDNNCISDVTSGGFHQSQCISSPIRNEVNDIGVEEIPCYIDPNTGDFVCG